MDNQQRKINEADIAWLAGFWDGEGTIGLRLNKSHPKTKHGLITPYVQVANTSKPALERVDEILISIGVGHHIQSLKLHPRPGAISRLPQWRITVAGYQRVSAFIMHVSPYLTVKQPAAQVVKRFIELRASKDAREPYADEEWQLLADIRSLTTRSHTASQAHSLEPLTD